MFLPGEFYEANQASSTCRLRFKPTVETSTPPFSENERLDAALCFANENHVAVAAMKRTMSAPQSRTPVEQRDAGVVLIQRSWNPVRKLSAASQRLFELQLFRLRSILPRFGHKREHLRLQLRGVERDRHIGSADQFHALQAVTEHIANHDPSHLLRK